jgi:hypothetical protein
MVKFRKAGDTAAYEIADGVFDRDEAAKLGLAVVEVDPTSGAPTAYGRYKNAPDGGPLGITTVKPGDTEVVAGGDVGLGGAPPAGNKGNLINPDDPVIHGGSDEIHKDGAAPPVENLEAERAEAVKVAEQSIEDASKPRKAK